MTTTVFLILMGSDVADVAVGAGERVVVGEEKEDEEEWRGGEWEYEGGREE